MKYLLWLIIPALLFGQRTVTQTGIKKSMIRGDLTTLTWTVPGDYSSDSLSFVVKNSADPDGVRLIQKTTGAGTLTATYVGSKTTLSATINTNDTQGFTAATYYYDIYNYTDSLTLVIGILVIQEDVSSPADGVATSYPYYTVALDTPNVANTWLIGQDSTNVWYRRTTPEARTILGIDTITGATNLPDSVVYDSQISDFVDKSTTQTITGQKNFMGTVKVGSDTSVVIGGSDPLGSLPVGFIWNRPNNYATYYSLGDLFTTRVPGLDSISDWTMNFRTWEFNNVMGHGMYLGLNENHRRPDEPTFSFVAEAPYRWQANSEVYEWYWAWQNKYPTPDYSYRPLGLAIYYPRDSVTNESNGAPTVELDLDFSKILLQDKDRNFIGQMILDGGGTSSLIFYDTTIISNSINDLAWLFQGSNAGGSIEIVRVDLNNNVVISPSAQNLIDLRNPLVKDEAGTVKWWNTANTSYIPITVDSSDRVAVGSGGGLFTQRLTVGYFPTDTNGVASGRIVANPNSGVLTYLLPQNLLSGGDFANWSTYGTYSIPDGWSSPDTTVLSVEENPAGRLHITSNGTSAQQIYSSETQTSGLTYGFSFSVYEPVDSFIVYGGGVAITVTAAGDYVSEFTSTSSNPLISFVPYANGISHEITVDNVKVWEKDGLAKQAIYDFQRAPVNAWDISLSKTILLNIPKIAPTYDSLYVVDVQDSICVQVYYMDGVTEYDMLSSPDTLVAGDTMILFDQNRTVPIGDKVYMKFIYIGDNEADLKSQIYWRE